MLWDGLMLHPGWAAVASIPRNRKQLFHAISARTLLGSAIDLSVRPAGSSRGIAGEVRADQQLARPDHVDEVRKRPAVENQRVVVETAGAGSA